MYGKEWHGCVVVVVIIFFFFNDTATTEIYTLSLHDALPILLKNIGTNSKEDRLMTLPKQTNPQDTLEN